MDYQLMLKSENASTLVDKFLANIKPKILHNDNNKISIVWFLIGCKQSSENFHECPPFIMTMFQHPETYIIGYQQDLAVHQYIFQIDSMFQEKPPSNPEGIRSNNGEWTLNQLWSYQEKYGKNELNVATISHYLNFEDYYQLFGYINSILNDINYLNLKKTTLFGIMEFTNTDRTLYNVNPNIMVFPNNCMANVFESIYNPSLQYNLEKQEIIWKHVSTELEHQDAPDFSFMLQYSELQQQSLIANFKYNYIDIKMGGLLLIWNYMNSYIIMDKAQKEFGEDKATFSKTDNSIQFQIEQLSQRLPGINRHYAQILIYEWQNDPPFFRVKFYFLR